MASPSTFTVPGLTLFRRGKVRETFDLGDRLLMVATDRISAYDSVLPTPIPGKGIVLTQLSRFWFDRTKDLVPNHLITTVLDELPAEALGMRDELDQRSMIVKKAERIDIECVARGYLAGSAWDEYQQSGTACGIKLPENLVNSSKLPEPIFTPATKNDDGHDENISFETLVGVVGEDLATQLRDATLKVYSAAEEYARGQGVIIADTKLEFGFVDGVLTIIDEMLTPDSSRFWDVSLYQPGKSQPSFDKQYVRD
ncbi:MAG TPA: phosphoribosylaminoimidazolesuccinocarboxamide synthase, partial [Thermomicrobiaceae bacterium]|nr:phosphoribosylaminoimidazolesuccinocarboxamide synthase [Thermomicrobiaceae bacterium]